VEGRSLDRGWARQKGWKHSLKWGFWQQPPLLPTTNTLGHGGGVSQP